MAAKLKRDFGGSLDAILDDLLGSDDEAPAKPTRASQLGGRAQSTSVQASKKSFLKDDFISKLPAEDTGAAEGSSASDADAQAVLQTLKDIEEMEADLLGISKPSSGPRKTSVKGAGKHDSLGGAGKPPTHEKEPPQTPLHTATPVRRRRREFTFEEDGDDLLNMLGLDSGLKGDGQQGKKAEEEELRPARSKLDELLGRGSMAKVLEQSVMGDRKEFQLDKKCQKQPEKEEGCKEEDFVFGAYQPSVASTVKHRPARRPSVRRFSAENSSEPKPEPRSKPPPASRSPVQGSRTGGDWLGLKDKDFLDSEPPSPAKASPAASDPSPTSPLPAAEQAATKPSPVEEESWLTAALSRKKAQAEAKARAQERSAEPSEAQGKELDPHSPIRQMAASAGAPQQAAASQEKVATADGSGQPIPWLSTPKAAPAHPSEAANKVPSRDASALVPTALILGEQETPSSQVRTLKLEQAQHRLLLESLQQRHREDLELLESAHRSRVKVMEETYGQREERLRQEKEQLVAQLLSQSRDAEQARAELVAQHQQRLATLEQQSALELERLRELQRVSVQEMRKDHEEQLQRLKQLKDQEIDTVTSAASHARSLNGVTEQMEKFSSDLHNLLHKVEAMHHSTSQELALGAQHRDQQLKVLQDWMSQQQRDMEEERSRLQEVIARMESRLGEQTRLLEQERWRATAEQSKVESLQHSLEEQWRIMTQQLSMERAELERAKSALLEEQKSGMQKCSEERRKLAAEWAEFRTQQQLSRQWMERETERTLQMHSQREGTILSLAKEQADLKIWSRELKAKEEQLARDRELLDEAWRELRLEKEKVNRSALRIQQQEEKIKSMTNLSSQKYDQGERALREACRMESEQQGRLQVMQQHLKQQEQHLHEDQLSMAYQRQQLQKLCEDLPSNPAMLPTAEQDLSAPVKGLSTLSAAPYSRGVLPDFPPPLGTLPRHNLGRSRETLAVAGSMEFYITLLKYSALQDHRFLEEEDLFLESLRNAPHRTAPRSG
ncbi:fas-binding factor 1 homolog isoform X4 [Cuculus canorus]|uniref:fas-binding factor 1 homolog isoform X4 n=1 Tax=Cuculus canorus TaxID=55661 RepID=UPI0023AAC60D|nr:fas-binding factor 1 homolog isoform X4 [Cuculus canorus]